MCRQEFRGLFCTKKYCSGACKRRAGQLWTKFRLTPQAYNEKIEQQLFNCGLCHKPLSESRDRRSPCVDHDHDCCPPKHGCGKCNRSIVHSHCNHIIGFVEKNGVDLDMGVVTAYIRSWKEVHA